MLPFLGTIIKLDDYPHFIYKHPLKMVTQPVYCPSLIILIVEDNLFDSRILRTAVKMVATLCMKQMLIKRCRDTYKKEEV